jgi:uncharacterized protein YndB with AHSA1/START domain
MTVISTTRDAASLTLTLVAEFDADPARVWQVWQDPRQLERWWGPPGFPATFTRHDFVVGGESRYHLTGPAGEGPRGWWRIDAIDEPHRLEFVNGLAGDDGEPAPGIEPTAGHITFDATDTGTRLTAVVSFIDAEQMESMVDVGMPEGMAQAIGQIDAVLGTATA